MSLVADCPRCPIPVAQTGADRGWACPEHGPVTPLWRPVRCGDPDDPASPQAATYDDFLEHLRHGGSFPTYLPWPLSPGWRITDFGVVADRDGAVATTTCCSGTSELDGHVDVLVVVEEPGTGLGSRLAGISRDDPGTDLSGASPAVRVRIASSTVPLWPVSTSGVDGEWDRSVMVGEAHGRWLWLAMRPASALLLLRDDWILRDVSGLGPPLVELPFGVPRRPW